MESDISGNGAGNLSRGFTLAECLIVLTVIGLVVAFSVPSFEGMFEEYRVKRASRQLASDFQLARAKAVSDKVEHRVHMNTINNRYWIERGDMPVESRVWNATGVVRGLGDRHSPYFVEGILLGFPNEDDAASDRSIIFSPLGKASPGITVSLTSFHNRRRQVVVAPTGRVQVE
jgi:prepilin-type N-terminal cleavage/methylation domain-containing protein